MWKLVIHPSTVAACSVAYCPIPARRREPENNLRGEHACPLATWVAPTKIPRTLPFRPMAKAKYDTIPLQLQPPLCVAFALRLAVCLRAPFKKLIATCASFVGIFRNLPPLLLHCCWPIHWRPPPRGTSSVPSVLAPLRSRLFPSLSRLLAYALSYFSPLFLLVCYSEE